MNCAKYEKKAFLGAILFTPPMIFIGFDLKEITPVILDIFIFISPFIGFYIASPYIKCIEEFRNRHNPPHFK